MPINYVHIIYTHFKFLGTKKKLKFRVDALLIVMNSQSRELGRINFRIAS